MYWRRVTSNNMPLSKSKIVDFKKILKKYKMHKRLLNYCDLS